MKQLRKTSLFLYSAALLFLVTVLLGACGVVPVTGRKQLSLVSDQEIVAISTQQYTAFVGKAAQRGLLDRSSSQAQRVIRVGSKIANATDAYLKKNGFASSAAQLKWEFNLIKQSQVNAFCMPGGKIVVYSGILPYCDTDERLAAVIAHEVAHAVAKHSNERLSNEMARRLGAQLLAGAVGGATRSAAMTEVIGQAYGLGTSLFVALPYNRKQEYEADQIGMVFMALAGYDPAGSLELWKKMSSRSKGERMEFLSTHPSDANRIKAIQNYLPEARKYLPHAQQTSTKTSSGSQKRSGGGFTIEKR